MLRTAVDSQGGAPGKLDCAQDAPDVCSFFAHYGGALIAFVANTLTGYRDQSTVAIADIQNTTASRAPTAPSIARRAPSRSGRQSGMRPASCQWLRGLRWSLRRAR